MPRICLQVPALSHSGAASGLRGGSQWAGISRPWSQSSEGLGAGPGVVAESLGSVSRISFLEGEGANFRLSPTLFPAPQLDWLTFWEIHLPLTLGVGGCHLVEDFEARTLKGLSGCLNRVVSRWPLPNPKEGN